MLSNNGLCLVCLRTAVKYTLLLAVNSDFSELNSLTLAAHSCALWYYDCTWHLPGICYRQVSQAMYT